MRHRATGEGPQKRKGPHADPLHFFLSLVRTGRRSDGTLMTDGRIRQQAKSGASAPFSKAVKKRPRPRGARPVDREESAPARSGRDAAFSLAQEG